MADNIAKMRAALNDGTSVTVQGISPEQLSAMQTATNYANANYPQTEKQTSLLQNVPSLDDISNFIQNFPVEAQRFLTNPQAFTQAITGKNPLPEETGFAASFTGLPEKNPNSLFTPEGMAYSKGYETGEPYGIAGMALPLVSSALKPTSKMLAEMANEQIMNTGNIKLAGLPEIPIANFAVKPSGGNWATNRLDMVVDPLKISVPKINPTKNITQEASNFIRQTYPHVDQGYNQYFASTGKHSMDYSKDFWSWIEQNYPKEFDALVKGTTPNQSLNKWIDSKLKKYIRNDLATPNDPARELADQGISHISNLEDRYTGLSNMMKAFREKQGFNPLGYSKTNMGHVWENLADGYVFPQSIKDYIGDMPATANKNPWMTDLYMKDPTAKINEIAMDARVGLGFQHLVDELHNSIHFNSDLPQHLRLKPEALDRVTVPQAIQHVAKVNSWRAEQMAKASKESLKDFPIVQESPDGYNIHELKLPEEIPANWKQNWENGEWISPEGKISHKDPRYEILDKALKNEGKQMGHCVGGYTEDVARGDSRIFTLRDPKGGAHVTIEAIPKLYNWDEIPQEVKDASYAAVPPHIYSSSQPAYEIREAYIRKWMEANPKLQIEQIKGKSNGPVAQKYRSYIENFLNKQGNQLSQVKDLENVGLADLKSFEKNPNWSHYATHAIKPGELEALGFEFPDALMLKLKELFPSQRFVSLEEIRAALNLPPVK